MAVRKAAMTWRSWSLNWFMMAVVVPGVLGQDAAEVPLAEDQNVVQALAS